MNKLIAQVAVEAIINNPEAYDYDTKLAVTAVGQAEGVSNFYLDMLDATVVGH